MILGLVATRHLWRTTELGLDILRESYWSIFPLETEKYQDKLSKKQWQDLIDFRNANGFAVLTASRPELRVASNFVCYAGLS
jgi:hypothetical protein